MYHVFQIVENYLLIIAFMVFTFCFVHKERTLNQNAISQFPAIKKKCIFYLGDDCQMLGVVLKDSGSKAIRYWL